MSLGGSVRRFISFPVYLFNPLYQYGCVDICFILWVIILFYLFCYSRCSSFGHRSLFQLIPLLFLSYSSQCESFLCFCFQLLPYFLTEYSRLSLYIYCASPRMSHFSKEPYFFIWRMVLETKVWLVGVIVALSNTFSKYHFL